MGLHPLNRYAKERPDFGKLADEHPTFEPFVKRNADGEAYINFQDAKALRALATTLLKEDWDLDVQLLDDRLCPTLASRLEYLMHVLDLEDYFRLDVDHQADSTKSDSDINPDRQTSILDIGTGHVAIYALLLHRLRPQAVITATESDETSFEYAQTTLDNNGISPDQIFLLRAQVSSDILFPLRDRKVDIVICNPPFYASLQELEEGMERKEGRPHAAPTAANNELITRGGEVSFVGKMIMESIQLKDRARWFTSLVGIYSSLQPLVELLRTHQITNYFIKSIRPAKTSRWILGWSFGQIRLPDSLTRPSELFDRTSYARLLPPPNTLRHHPLHPPLSTSELSKAVYTVLSDIKLYVDKQESEHKDSIIIRPTANTWSRTARRLAMRAANEDEVMEVKTPSEPMFIARISFEEINSEDEEVSEDQQSGSTVVLDFLSGPDRDLVDSLWRYVLNKAELLRDREHPQRSPGPGVGDGEQNRYMPRGRGNGRGTRGGRGGGRGGRRGRGRISWGS